MKMLTSKQDKDSLGGDDNQQTAVNENVTQLLRDAQRLVSRTLSDRLSKRDVSIGQWYFLRALWREDGLTQRELSYRVGMMEPTTVTALNGMERKNLVRRVRNPRDRRKINIFLTEKGRSLETELLPIEAEVSELAMNGLDPMGRDALIGALKVAIDNCTRIRR